VKGEDIALGVVDARADDVRLRLERLEGDGGRRVVVEGERGGAVGADDAGGGLQLADHVAAEGDLVIDDEGGAGQHEGDAAGEHADGGELALEGKVAKEAAHGGTGA